MSSERGNKRLKLIDRYLGIPAVFTLGLIKRKKRLPANYNFKTVAFLKTAAIGDTILMSASIKDLKEKYPDIHLTMFTSEANYEIGEMLSGIDRLVKIPVREPMKAVRLVQNSGEFDVWIDFGSWPRINAILSFFSNSKYKIGFKTSGQHKHYIFDKAICHNPDLHESNNYKNLLQPLGVEGNNLPCIERKTSGTVNSKTIVVHMYPGGEKFFLKQWPDEYWVELIDALTESDFKIYLTGSGLDREMAEQIKKRVENNRQVTVSAGRLSIKETADLLLSSQLVISVDTGIMHLASSLGCRVIAIHGPTSFKRWGVLNGSSISIQSKTACSPCINLGFDSTCTDNKCMREIQFNEVLEVIEKIIHAV